MTRRRLAAAVALGAVLYAGALVLVLTGETREPETLELFALVLIAGLVFTVTGAIAAARRPTNRTGAQMLAVGLVWSLGALQAADDSFPFTLGFVVSGVAFAAFAYLILSYPTGQLRPADRPLVWAVLAVVTLGPLAIAFVDPSPLPACENCPESAFLVADSRGLARAVTVTLALAAAAILTVIGLRLVRRYGQATPRCAACSALSTSSR